MNLDLRDFESFPVEVTLESEADSIEYAIDGVAFRDLMTVKVNIQKVDGEFYCQGYVTAPVEQECSRCLALFDAELSGDFGFIIRTGEGKTEVAQTIEEDIVKIKAYDPVVELDEIIRQSLILSRPLKALCRQDCKGLCPSCGADLNEETCDCKSVETDERWEGLKDLLE